MPFKPGTSGNPNGRPKGAGNKISNEIRSKIDTFLSDKINAIDELWNELEAKEKIALLTKLMDYSIPKLKQQDITISEYENLSDDDLQKMVDEILKQNTNESE